MKPFFQIQLRCACACIHTYSCVYHGSRTCVHDIAYFTSDGEDYSGGVFSLPLLRGESRNCLSISIVDDSILEDPPIETFQLFLSSVDPPVNGSVSMAIVQIVDDDGKPYIAC
jgi:hypothetical protein